MRRVVRGLPAFCFVVLVVAAISARAQGSLPPVILTQPESQSVDSGGSVSFSVQAEGASPLFYRWRLNGTNLPGATNAALSITNAGYFRGGPYSVAISNNFGAVTSAVALLTVDPDLVFRLVALETNGAIAIDHANQTGDDRGGIAVSASNVFVTGDGSGNGPATGRFSLDTLGNGTSLGRGYDALVSNLRTETLYSLGNGANLIQYTSGLNFTTVNSLIEINGQTGQPTGQRINLSTGITISERTVGVFAGYDRVVIHNGTRAYSIALPSGVVTDLGPMSTFTHNNTENNWAYWGIAEYTGSAIYLVYVQNSQNIVRTRVPDRATSTLLSVTGGSWPFDMASITFSLSRSRWYCHYEGTAFFRSGDEILGSAKGSYTTEAGYPSLMTEPADQVSYPGSNVTFAASAAGIGPLLYQWYFNSSPIPDATGPTLSLTNIDLAAAGLYRLDVNNSLGFVSSRSARLTIYSVPQIVSQPQSLGVLPGTNVQFRVSVNAAPPVSYHWRRNGTPIASPGSSVLQVTNVQAAVAGFYSVVVSNRFGTATSSNAELFVAAPVDDGSQFQVATLTSDGANTVDVLNNLGDYGYGPFAVSSNSVFYSSFNTSARNNADNLAAGAELPRFYAAFASNLRTETVYAPGTATGPFNNYNGGNLTTLWEVNGTSGALGSGRVTLSTPVNLPSFGNSTVGFFSGYDRIVVLISGVRAFSIALPSGAVTDLGPMGSLQHGFSFSGAFWGIAEQVGGITYLLYCQNSQNIVRARVPDGVTSIVATFPQLNSYFSSISASIRRGRWYYHYQFGNSTFGAFNSAVGYANATFNINSGSKADHFEWDTVPPVQVLNAPFPVRLTAKNTTNFTITNYQGTVTLSAVNVAGQTAVPITPTTISGFVNGVWIGQISVLAASTGMVLRATDANGLFGASGVFSVNPTNDLSLAIRESADPVVPGGSLTYTLTITNTGPAPASGVWLTNQLPAGTVLNSFTSSQGNCSANAGVLLCDLGTVNAGTVVSVSVMLGTTLEGTLTYQASLARGEIDPASNNNSVTETTEVRLPMLVIDDVSITEGNAGTNEVVFSVRLSPVTTNFVSVNFATINGTATPTGSNPDFLTNSGTLVFPPGSTNQSVAVRVRGDVLNEANEVFYVSLNAPTNATVGRAIGTATIVNDDLPPFISVSSLSVGEGNAGVANAIIQVRLSTTSGVPVTVAYTTFDGTATGNEDFTNVFGVVAFPANTPNLTRNIVVPIRGDTNVEPNEFFYVQLTTATNAILSNTLAICTITNDDGGGILHHFDWAPVPSPQPANTAFPATLYAQDVFNKTVTNFGGTLQLSAGGGADTESTIFGDAEFTDINNLDYTLGYTFTPKFDMIVTHFRHYSGTRVSLWAIDGTVLATRAVTSTNGSWTETPLAEPVQLQAGETYVLAFYTGGLDQSYYSRNDGNTDFSHLTISEGRYGQFDTFPVGNTTFVGWIVDIRYLASEGVEPVPISPTVTASFSRGVWNGMLTVQASATNIILTATDGQGRSARSTRFDTITDSGSDLQISVTASTDTVSLGSNLTYSVTVSNRGPLAAIDAMATNNLPAGFTFVSASASQGSATNSGGIVTAQLGGLSRGGQATVTIRARADAAGWQTNRASAGGSRSDPVLLNNHAELATLVFRDSDGDGIWDDWELLHGMNSNDPSDAALDLDGDGHTSLEEFLAGTEPNDASSVLRILSIETAPSGARLRFHGVRGKTYLLQSKDDVFGPWSPVFVFGIDASPGSSDIIELNDPTPPVAETRTYRVRAMPP